MSPHRFGRKPQPQPTKVSEDPPERYVVLITYPGGANFSLTFPGRSAWTHEYDPVPIVDCITKALREEGFDVQVAEERKVVSTRWPEQ